MSRLTTHPALVEQRRAELRAHSSGWRSSLTGRKRRPVPPRPSGPQLYLIVGGRTSKPPG